MNDRLATYVHDHLAGATFAVSLLGDLKEQRIDAEVAALAPRLLLEIEEDRSVLVALSKHVSKSEGAFKRAVAWVAQRTARLKLTLSDPLGVFEAVEMLALGVQGKRALWTALAGIAAADERLSGIDFDLLIQRAERQHQQLETLRLQLATRALGSEIAAKPPCTSAAASR
jgi:hypothetical protein